MMYDANGQSSELLDISDPATHQRSVSITVDLSAIRKNMATARRLSVGSKLFATIKADAYGHGAVAVAHALTPTVSMHQYRKPSATITEPVDAFADGFAVVSIGEAVELRLSGIKQPILILQGPQQPDDCEQLISHQLWPVIHDMCQFEWFSQYRHRSRINAWLKVDTGMGRLGFQPDEAKCVLAANVGINWQGILTHFACADEIDNPFTEHQISVFDSIGKNSHLERSLANSSAVLCWPKAIADWARPGLMLYGCNPLDRQLPDGVVLHTAMTVRAPLIAVKKLRAGAGVGYAHAWHCPEDMPVGYLALGYRDGLPRVLDETASVVINGATCPIVGRVSMDSIAVDLRSCPRTTVGSIAEFWGENASIDNLASAAGTINYELLTSIRGKRSYVTDG